LNINKLKGKCESVNIIENRFHSKEYFRPQNGVFGEILSPLERF